MPARKLCTRVRLGQEFAKKTKRSNSAFVTKSAAKATMNRTFCWRKPPTIVGKQWIECGMGAAVDDTTCAFVIADQILGPIFAVINIVSLGTASGASLRLAMVLLHL